MLDSLAGAARLLLEWPNPPLIVVGVVFGMLIGMLPGLAGGVALALLVPVTFTMEPQTAVLFLIAAYSPAGFGGMLTSILVNTPGSPENAATTFDGYPMARQGRAPTAIGAATAASFLGGLVGTVLLILLVPVAHRFVLAFSYPEFFMMSVFGLTVIAVVTRGRTYKGLISAGIGFLLAFVGLGPSAASPRFTAGLLYLWDGIPVIPAIIGLFAGAEVLALYGEGRSIGRANGNLLTAASTFAGGVKDTLRHWVLVLRSSVIGTVIGVVPGVGGSVASFLAYGQAAQTSKTPERFGRGAVEGVIAAESANDAKEGGSLLPTVAFGIPGSVGMAILMGALVLHGVAPGPTLITEHADLVYALIMGMVAAKLIAPFVTWLVSKRALHLTRVRPEVVTPVVVVAALVGAYTVRVQILDVAVALIFAYVGHAMEKHGFSRVALVIALILGGLVETSYHQTVAAFGGVSGFVTRPISAALVVLCLASLLAPAILARRRRVRGDGDVNHVAVETGGTTRSADAIVFDVVLLGFAGAVVAASLVGLSPDARLVPLIVGVPTVVGATVQLLRDLFPGVLSGRGRRRSAEGEPAGGPEPAVRTVARRKVVFAAWAVGFFLLSAALGFLVSIPVALAFFLWVIARERWTLTITLSLGSWAFVWLLFGVVLNVDL